MKRLLLLILLLCFGLSIVKAQPVTINFRIGSTSPPLMLPQNSPIEVLQYDVTITRSTVGVDGNYAIIFKPFNSTNEITLFEQSSLTWNDKTYTSPVGTSFNVSTSMIQNREGKIYVRFRHYFSTPIFYYNDESSAFTVQIAVGNNTISGNPGNYTGSIDPNMTGSTPTGGNNGAFTYQWQSSSNANPNVNASYTNITGATSKDLNPPLITSTRHYRRIAITGDNHTELSNTLSYFVGPQPLANNTITTTGTLVFDASGGNPTVINGSTPIGGSGAYTYQWQSSPTSTDNDFTNITGANSINYDPPAITQTTYYRRMVTSGPNTIASGYARFLVVLPITNNIITYSGTTSFFESGNPSRISGDWPSGGGGSGSVNFQWEVSVTSASSGFSSVWDETDKEYNPPVITTTSYYRRRVTSNYFPNVTSVSNVITITIVTPISNNIIANTGSSTFVDNADPSLLSGSNPGGGGDSFTYKWERSLTSASSGFSVISGTTSQSYDPVVISSTAYYRRVVASTFIPSVTSTSNVVTITVNITGTTMANPIILGDVGLCTSSSGGQPVGIGRTEFYYRFNLTALGRLHMNNCRSDGTPNGVGLLDSNGNQVTGVIYSNELCDVGSQWYYDNLPIGTYYATIGTSDPNVFSMVFGMYLEPIMTVSPSVTIVLGQSATLSASGNGIVSYVWSPGTGLNTTTGASVVATPTQTTGYQVKGYGPTGCIVYGGVQVTVTGLPGSTMSNPINVPSIGGCGYNSPIVNVAGYADNIGYPGNEDVFYKFTISTTTEVDFYPLPYYDNYIAPMHLMLLNSLGSIISEKTFGIVEYSEGDNNYSYYGPLDWTPNYRATLSPGTYYMVVEPATTLSNVYFSISIQTPSGYACRVAAPETKDIVTGLSPEVDDEEYAFVYPNPANQFISLKLAEGNLYTSISIVDVSGKIVKTSDIKNNESVDVSNLSPGFYTIKIKQQDKEINKKLLIQR